MSKKKRERGIFGIQKRKSVLFTFHARDGEECSSDSEDSDYFPGRQSTDEDNDEELVKKADRKNRKKAKLELSQESPSQKKTRRTRNEGNVKPSILNSKPSEQVWLPPELMLRIFQYVVAMEGITKVLPRISKVCKEWHNLARDPCLFERIDLSADQIKLSRLCQEFLLKHDLSQCQYLSLSSQFKVQSNVVESLLSCTPRLMVLDLFGCPNIRPDLIKRIPELCPQLQRLDLSHPTDFSRNFTVPTLETMIRGCGPTLVELRLAGISVVKQSVRQFLKIIQESCPLLEELDIRTNVQHHCKVDMPSLMKGCPKLKEVRFDGYSFTDKVGMNEPYPGLPKLQIYSQSGLKVESNEPQVFYKMFSAVQKLTYLNIGSSNLLPGHITQWVKAVDHLVLCDMRWRNAEQANLIQCIDAWLLSLKTLDLSHNKLNSGFLDAALQQYHLNQDPTFQGHPLQRLNLSNSNVTVATVQQVVKACSNLKEIDLTSCRELPRGSKRLFRQDEFKFLLRSLNSLTANNAKVDTDSDSDET